MIYFNFYPRECDNPKIIPLLDSNPQEFYNQFVLTEEEEDDLNTYWKFFEACKKFGEYDIQNHCYIFRDIQRIFEFAALPEVPTCIADYVSYTEYIDKRKNVLHTANDIFIIWDS